MNRCVLVFLFLKKKRKKRRTRRTRTWYKLYNVHWIYYNNIIERKFHQLIATQQAKQNQLHFHYHVKLIEKPNCFILHWMYPNRQMVVIIILVVTKKAIQISNKTNSEQVNVPMKKERLLCVFWVYRLSWLTHAYCHRFDIGLFVLSPRSLPRYTYNLNDNLILALTWCHQADD